MKFEIKLVWNPTKISSDIDHKVLSSSATYPNYKNCLIYVNFEINFDVFNVYLGTNPIKITYSRF
jgi:hypothetical protein